MGAAFVGMDNTQSMRMLVNYLCDSGSPPNFLEMRTAVNPNVNRRRNAYVSAMEALGHPPEIVRIDGEGWEFEEIGLQGGLSAFATGRFTSDTILCSNDRLAIGLLSAAYRSKLTVGRGGDSDLRIAGHDDHPDLRIIGSLVERVEVGAPHRARPRIESVGAVQRYRRNTIGGLVEHNIFSSHVLTLAPAVSVRKCANS